MKFKETLIGFLIIITILLGIGAVIIGQQINKVPNTGTSNTSALNSCTPGGQNNCPAGTQCTPDNANGNTYSCHGVQPNICGTGSCNRYLSFRCAATSDFTGGSCYKGKSIHNSFASAQSAMGGCGQVDTVCSNSDTLCGDFVIQKSTCSSSPPSTPRPTPISTPIPTPIPTPVSCGGSCTTSTQCQVGHQCIGKVCLLNICVKNPSICQAGGCIPVICGNGILNTGEACDDGNLINGDGCSASCQIEKIPKTALVSDSTDRLIVGITMMVVGLLMIKLRIIERSVNLYINTGKKRINDRFLKIKDTI